VRDMSCDEAGHSKIPSMARHMARTTSVTNFRDTQLLSAHASCDKAGHYEIT